MKAQKWADEELWDVGLLRKRVGASPRIRPAIAELQFTFVKSYRPDKNGRRAGAAKKLEW